MTDQIAHLHVHTDYSMLDGAAKVKKLAARAAELGQPAVAQTDHGNMWGAFEFWEAATAAGVKPILGIEAYLAPKSRKLMEPVFWGGRGDRGEDVGGGGSYTHITLLAETPQGLLNLFRMSSLGSLEGQYNKPRVDWDLLREHHEGVIATSGCLGGEVQTRLRLGQFDEALAAAANAREVFGADNYFLEVMEHGIPLEWSLREGLLDIGRRLGIRPVATNDSHYVFEDQAEAHDALLCVGVNKKLADPARFRFGGSGYHLKSAAEMREIWDTEVPGACDNTLLIAERVGDYAAVFAPRDLAPEFPVPEGETQESWLRTEVTRGARARFGEDISREIQDRIDYELGVIVQKGYPAYFLVVADICAYAASQGIRVGPGRGSAAGSMIAYVLGITQIDPIKHDLIFERFLNPERPSPPDIDLDFDERFREQMISYVTRKYGEDRVAQIITMGMIKAKAAVKDAARVLDLPYSLGDRVSKALPPSSQGHDVTLAEIFESDKPPGEAAEIRGMYGDEPDVKRVIDVARGLEGLIRSSGVHAAGVVLSKQSLIEVMPIHRRKADNAIITGFTFTQVEELGAIKMDFLGLRNLWTIDAAIAEIKANRGVDIDTSTIPLDDEKTLAMLGRGETLGVFQLDGGAMRELLKSMQVDAFGDIVAAVALYRPGPMGANAHNDYADRKQGRQQVIPIHPELEEVLGPILDKTYGLVVYQEQVLSIAQKVAGYSLGAADLLRRAMGKKKPEVMAAAWQQFSEGMTKNGYSEEAAKALWDILVPFSGYGFNKSHSAPYGLLAYWTGYLKANYPAEFMAALLTSVGDNKDKMALYLSETRRMGIEVLPPDVNESGKAFTAVSDDRIRFGLSAVSNVGENVVAAIISGRPERGYASFQGFLRDSGVGNKRVVESLIKAGGLDSYGYTRQGLYACHEQAVNVAVANRKSMAAGQESLFADEEDCDAADDSDLGVGTEEWPQDVKLAFEREMLGMYVSAHPLDGMDQLLDRHRETTIPELLASGRTEGAARIAGVISHVDNKVHKSSGKPWAVVTVADRDGTVEVLFSTRDYPLYAAALREDALVSVRVRLNKRDEDVSYFGMELSVLEADRDPAAPVTVSVREEAVSAEVTTALRAILVAHPGPAPVRMRVLRTGREAVLMELPGFRVDPKGSFPSEVKGLLGAAALA